MAIFVWPRQKSDAELFWPVVAPPPWAILPSAFSHLVHLFSASTFDFWLRPLTNCPPVRNWINPAGGGATSSGRKCPPWTGPFNCFLLFFFIFWFCVLWFPLDFCTFFSGFCADGPLSSIFGLSSSKWIHLFAWAFDSVQRSMCFIGCDIFNSIEWLEAELSHS